MEQFICILIIIILSEIVTGGIFYVYRSRVRYFNPYHREKNNQNLFDSMLEVSLFELMQSLILFSLQILQMTSGVSSKMMSAYKPENRHAIDGIQERVTCTTLFMVFVRR